jgi:long-chain acyl-CoA synthetase
MRGRTLHGVLRSKAEEFRERVAFNVFKDRWEHLTYGEFLKKAEALSTYLRDKGVGKGDRVSIVAENRPEWCASYLGVLLAGGVAVPVDARSTTEEMRNIVSDSGTRLVLHTEETGAVVREALQGLSAGTLDLDAFPFREAHSSPEPHDIKEDDMASLIYTSGTTGAPKAVMLTHGNILSDAEDLIKLGIISERENVLSLLPLHHTYPFMGTFIVPLIAGGRITYPPGLKGPDIVNAVRDTEVTVVVGVPQLLEIMLQRMMGRIRGLPVPLAQVLLSCVKISGLLRRKADINLMGAVFRPFGSQFRFFTSGGARLDPEVMKGLEALGLTVLEGYGLTETSPAVTFNPPEKRKPGSVGIALPSAEIKILPPHEGPGGEGEIAIRGPMLMKGYYQNPELTASVVKDGWFHSGDLGFLDEEGYLFITGRLKELIVLSSGKNVYPEEVEDHYLKSPLIKEICVMQQEGRLQAAVVPDTDYARREKIGNINEAIRWEMERLSSSLSPHMRVKGYALRQAPLPRTPLGKLRRFMIKGAERVPKERDRALMEDEVGRTVTRCLAPFSSGEVRSSDSLELDLGLDSLKRLELAASLEKALGVGLPEGLVFEVQTVGDLVEGVKTLKAAAFVEEAPEEPLDKEKRRVGLKRSPLEGLASFVLWCLVRLVLKVFFRLTVRGLENLPPPPFIIAANHTSYLDGFAMGTGVPLRVFRTLYFQGLKRYFIGRLTSLFARLAHVIPIDPFADFGRALRLSSHALKEGNSLCIFPEGGRSFEGKLMDFKKGIGILALEANIPVVAARIRGTFEILPRGARWPRPGRIEITFGRPLLPSSLDYSQRPEGIDEPQFLADEIRKRVSET